MRTLLHRQSEIGEISVSQVWIDPKSRDDIPQILRGLQYVYTKPLYRDRIFSELEKLIGKGIRTHTGRPGMELWRIFVLGVLRLNLDLDYDRLQELANQHLTIREMLGHGEWDKHYYEMQTLKDNICLFTPEILDRINQIVIEAGHGLIKKKEVGLKSRCDSFVVKTNVHFPTDINLLYDAMRKALELTAQQCQSKGMTQWRQFEHHLRKIKKSFRQAQASKLGSGKNPDQKIKRVQKAHQDYLQLGQTYLKKIEETLAVLQTYSLSVVDFARMEIILSFIQHAKRQIDQISRRVLKGEVIPHSEKVFSLFEPHTEWISKGKAGVPVELGVRVCILEDSHQFILHHHVMTQQTDDKVAVQMVQEAKVRYPHLASVSYDRGFYSPENVRQLQTIVEAVALPKKGRLTNEQQQQEQTEKFLYAKRGHSAIESAIHGLDVHGLDQCPDHGLKAFERYVALAITSRNIQRVGAILQHQAYRLFLLRQRRSLLAA